MVQACIGRVWLPTTIAGAWMKKPLAAAVAICALSVVNSAGAVPPVYGWAGFYLGANGGGGWANQSSSLTGAGTFGGAPVTTVGSGSASGSGGLAGGQIGFNYEFPIHIVLGVEADVDLAHIGASSSGCNTVTSFPFAGIILGCGLSNNSLNDFGTIRGRLGYAWNNNVLVFGTGGWAWGNSSGNFSLTCLTEGAPVCPAPSPLPFTGGTASFSNTLSGRAAGGGVEWMFLPRWTFESNTFISNSIASAPTIRMLQQRYCLLLEPHPRCTCPRTTASISCAQA